MYLDVLSLARCDRMSIRRLLLIPGFHKHLPYTSFNSRSSPLFHLLCLGDSVSVCIHPCLSRPGFLCDLSIIVLTSFSTVCVVWFDRSSMRCHRCTTWTTSSVTVSLDVSRQHVESSGLGLWNFPATILGNGGPAPSSSVVTFFVSFKSGAHHLPRRATQAVQFVAFHASLSVYRVQLLPRTTPFLVIHRTALVRS